MDLVSRGLLEGSVREDQAWMRLGTYGLLEDNVIVSKLEHNEQDLDGKRYLLER